MVPLLVDRRSVTTTRRTSDEGFSLVELVTAMALMLVIGALSLAALVNYRNAQGQQQTADTLLSDLRKAGQRAVSEGRTYCLYVNDAADSWSTFQTSCSATSLVVDPAEQATKPSALGDLTIATPVTAACPTAGACVYFHPRGTATQSSIAVTRDGKPSITVTVEGLTGRVDRT
jgi:type II secretory pathway pseudopilin PulG